MEDNDSLNEEFSLLMTMVIMIIAVVMMMTYDQVIMMVINNDVYFQLKEFSDYVLLVKYL